MLFRLAEMEHTTDVDGLARRLSYRQFREWQAYDQISPIGGLRIEVAVATLAMIVANALRSKDSSAYGIEEFLFFHPFNGGSSSEPKTPDEIQATLTACFGEPTILTPQPE